MRRLGAIALVATVISVIFPSASSADEQSFVGHWSIGNSYYQLPPQIEVTTGGGGWVGTVTVGNDCFDAGDTIWTVSSELVTGDSPEDWDDYYRGTASWCEGETRRETPGQWRWPSGDDYIHFGFQIGSSDQDGDGVDDESWTFFEAHRTTPIGWRIASASFPLTHRIERARRQLTSEIDPLLAEYQSAAEEALDSQESVDQAAELHAFRVANVNTIEGQISELRQDIADGIGREDSEEMDRRKQDLYRAHVAEFAQRLELQRREKRLERDVIHRDALASRLLRFVQPLEALDFELTGLDVTAGTEKVYEVDLTSPYQRLAELTRNIEEMSEIVEALRVEKKDAFAEFQSAHGAASTQLAAIADLIWNNALKKASIDFGTNACDLLIAGTKGGWAGVAAELASKVFEAWLKGGLRRGSVGDPNPGGEAVDAWFEQTTIEVVGSHARAIAYERGTKESVGKLLKEWIADKLATRWSQLRPVIPPGDNAPSLAVEAAKRRSRDALKRIRDLRPNLRTETFRSGFRDWALGSVGRKLLVDAGKAILNREMQNHEMRAWMTYMEMDVRAQGNFALWQAAANAYWEAHDTLVAFELEKERILSEFDPATGQSLKLRESFETPTTLRIRLTVPRSARPFEEIPVQVWVSGVQARRTSATVYEISTEQLSGTEFAIEVR